MTAHSLFRCIGSAVTLLAGVATGNSLVAAGSVLIAVMMFPPPRHREAREVPDVPACTVIIEPLKVWTFSFDPPDDEPDEPTVTKPDALAVFGAEFDAAIDRAARSRP